MASALPVLCAPRGDAAVAAPRPPPQWDDWPNEQHDVLAQYPTYRHMAEGSFIWWRLGDLEDELAAGVPTADLRERVGGLLERQGVHLGQAQRAVLEPAQEL